jgi:hypothetical protein
MVNSYFLLFGRKLHVEICIADFSFEIRIYSDVRYDFRITTMFGSFLPPVVCKRARVLFMLFVHSGVQHILCCVFEQRCWWRVSKAVPVSYKTPVVLLIDRVKSGKSLGNIEERNHQREKLQVRSTSENNTNHHI